jgi:hypothetical protein
MKCPACREENDDDAQFCIHCSHNFVRSPPTPQKKKGVGIGVWIGGAFVILVIVGFLSGWFSEPKYDCSVTEGYINIQNVPNSDAYMRLVDKNNDAVKTLYIRAGSQGTISGICNGRYYLHYEFGEQWNPSLKAFAVIKSREKFDDSFDFRGDNYFKVSLIPGSGNAQTSKTSTNETAQS